MIEKASVILHWNTDYAEFPRSEFPKVVEVSYEPMITAIEDGFIGTICMNLTGHTLEYLSANHPELIDRMKRLAKANVIEMLASGYSHPILPLLPRERVAIQLKDHIALLKKIFGKKPKGIWPPELAVSPSVLSQIKKEGIEWTVVDYEHYQLSQFFGNDVNPFEIREQTVTEFLVDAYWARGIRKLWKYLKSMRLLVKTNQEQIEPLRRVTINNNETIKAYLSSFSWTNTAQFAVGGFVPFYKAKNLLKLMEKIDTKILPFYASDIEFFGYRSMGPTPASPKSLIDFLNTLTKKGVKIASPTQIPDEDWPKDPTYLSTGSWAPDKSFRLWTDSEDNSEFIRRADEIYSILRARNWDKKLMKKLEPYLRIMENSDPRGWAPIPERKNEAYSAMAVIFDILDKS
ncbi:MAG: hypothetical protein FK732_02590 [Asgard group archaeon]|nr:hypothetical protein [Asgard group archaeon]